MTQRLKKSTASQVVQIGPFLDDDDGITPKTGLTIANTDIQFLKAGGTSFVNKNSGGATEIANGWYYITLDATDTNTAGSLIMRCKIDDCLLVFREWEVWDAYAYALDDTLKKILALGGPFFTEDTFTYDGTSGKMTGAIKKFYLTEADRAADTNVVYTLTLTATYNVSDQVSTLIGTST